MRPRVLAHRGDRVAGPENSLRAVCAAFAASDGAEVDVLVTADGHAVLRHDERLEDGTPVRALSLAEARRALGADSDDLPLVSDVLRRVGSGGGTLDLELKVPGALRALLAIGPLPTSVVFTSFHASEVVDARRHAPHLRVGLLIEGRLPRFVPVGTSFLAVEHGLLPIARAALPGAALWAFTIDGPGAIARASAAGCEVWIADDVAAARGAIGTD